MLDEQQRALAPQVPEDRHHPGGLLGSHARHRLVEQQQARPGGERHRDLELAMLAVGEVSGRVLGPLGEAHPREVVDGGSPKPLVPEGFAPHPVGVPRRRLHGEHSVFDDGERGKDARNLKRSGEPEPGAAMGGEVGDGPAAELDGPGVGESGARDLGDEGRLPRAVGADDGVSLVLEHVEVDAVGGGHAAEMAGEAPNREQRRLHPPVHARDRPVREAER